ncbi:hypothetical protein ACJX0J_025125, partial [Zea mays]
NLFQGILNGFIFSRENENDEEQVNIGGKKDKEAEKLIEKEKEYSKEEILNLKHLASKIVDELRSSKEDSFSEKGWLMMQHRRTQKRWRWKALAIIGEEYVIVVFMPFYF